jgi:hypothetical protein
MRPMVPHMESEMNHPDGPEQREAERLERDTYDHDTAADRADERPRSEFADMIFEVAKANVLASQSAFDAGHKAGFADGYRACLDSLDARVKGMT